MFGGHAALLFSPGDLLPRYILPPPTLTEPRSLLGALVIVAFVALAVFRKTRALPATRFAWFATLAFLPVAGILRNPRDLVDSYLYLPLAALAGLLGLAVDACLRRAERLSAAPRRVARTLAMIALPTMFLPWTLAQSAVWRNGESLWAYTLAAYPDSPQVCRSYGNALFFKQRFAEAVDAYERCARLHERPDVFENNIRIARERLRLEREAATSR